MDRDYENRSNYNDALNHYNMGVMRMGEGNPYAALSSFEECLNCLKKDDSLDSDLANKCKQALKECGEEIDKIEHQDLDIYEITGEKEYPFGKYVGEMIVGGGNPDMEYGKGIFRFNDGRYIESEEWQCWDCSVGKYVYPDLGVYEGEIKNLKKHGKGTFTLKDGSVYKGNWKNNFFDGEIELVRPNGEKVKYYYKDGQEVINNSKKR